MIQRKATLAGQPCEDLTYPLVETPDEWVLHGFSHANYLAEFGAHAQTKVYEKLTLVLAMRDAFIKTSHFLMMTKGLTEDEAISLMGCGRLRRDAGCRLQLEGARDHPR